MDRDTAQQIRRLRQRLDRTEAKPPGVVTTGIWTPAFAGTATAGVFTYTIQVGNYATIGRRMFIQFNVAISAITTPPVGNMVVTGLPVTPASDANSHHGVAFTTISNFNYSAAVLDLTARIPPSDPRIFLFESFDNAPAANAPAANFTNAACQLMGIGFYMI